MTGARAGRDSRPPGAQGPRGVVLGPDRTELLLREVPPAVLVAISGAPSPALAATSTSGPPEDVFFPPLAPPPAHRGGLHGARRATRAPLPWCAPSYSGTPADLADVLRGARRATRSSTRWASPWRAMGTLLGETVSLAFTGRPGRRRLGLPGVHRSARASSTRAPWRAPGYPGVDSMGSPWRAGPPGLPWRRVPPTAC